MSRAQEILRQRQIAAQPDPRPSFDEYFLGLAFAVAKRADCSRAQHGAVIVDKHNRVVSTGYNGAPSGQPGCLTAGACPRAQLSYDQLPAGSSYDTGPGACIALHAEQNAIVHGNWATYQGGTIYVTGVPCGGCAKLIAGSGLVRVVWPEGQGLARHS